MVPPSFHPLTAQWFTDRVGQPTNVQLQAWPPIAEGGHVLLTAPTGSGKTLAAFLVAIDRLLRGDWTCGGLRVLYLSPLKALNNDVRRNLLVPLAELTERFQANALSPPAVRVMVRSGDSTDAERRLLRRHPPEILITTPESLSILLTQKGGSELFAGLRAVIVDEIHAVIGSKRGTSLLVGLERLSSLVGDYQRIGLSATVRPPGLVGQALAGWDEHGRPRALSLVESPDSKQYELSVHVPPLPSEPDEAGKVFWAGLAVELRQRTRDRASTLIFTNSRRACERLARLMNENQDNLVAYSHHGSLSREVRHEVEARLKAGELRALVATNSLELGIDIGDLDEVILAQTPRSASSAIQKVGRAGHRTGEVSRARLYPSHGADLIAAAVILRCICEQSVEPVSIPEGPLDVLAQSLLSMLCPQPATADELYAVVTRSWPYRHLARKAFDLVLDQLAGRYEGTRLNELKPRIRKTADDRWEALESVPFLLYSSGGTIPDRGYFTLRDHRTGAPLGELDEEFVWERSLGDRFALGAQVWKIKSMNDQAVEVEPVDAPPHIIPFWKAEEQDRGWFLAEKLGLFLVEADRNLSDAESWTKVLVASGFQKEAADRLIHALERQKAAVGALPHRWRLVVERVVPEVKKTQDRSDVEQFVIHNLWGARLNRPWAFALAQAWEDRYGYALETYPGDDQILVLIPPDADLDDALSLVTVEGLEGLLRRRLETTGYFGARFREGAGRALLLPKSGFGRRAPLWHTRMKAKRLFDAVSRFPDFPIVLEAWRQCLKDEFDLPALKDRLDELASGRIEVHHCRTETPSPFTEGLLWRQVNTKMYDDDEPSGRRAPSVGEDLWNDLLAEERPLIQSGNQTDWESRWLRSAEGYAPESPAELADLLEVRVALTAGEWMAVGEAVLRDQGTDAHLAWSQLDVVRRGSLVFHPRTAEAWEAPETWWWRWLEGRGPLSLSTMADLWGQSSGRLEDWAAAEIAAKKLVRGRLTSAAPQDQLCRTEIWEQLIRRQKRSRTAEAPRRPAAELAGFLARWQGVAAGDRAGPLRSRIGQLLGLALPAALWEGVVVPCRGSGEDTAEWDDLFTDEGLGWFGAGPKLIALGFAEDAAAWVPAALSPEGSHEAVALFGPNSVASLPDLAARSGLSTAALTKRLWALAWQGGASSTTWAPVRHGLQADFRYDPGTEPGRGNRGLQRWSSARTAAGQWLRHPWPTTARTSVARLEDSRRLARQALDRYGVVFRSLLARELPAFQWRALFPALRLMELSGEVVGGLFWEGIGELQFALPAALDGLKEPLGTEHRWIQHSQDPSCLCGLGLGVQSNLPRRSEGTWLWWRGNDLASVVSGQGRRLETAGSSALGTEPGLSWFVERQAALFWRSGALRWTLETVDGAPAAESPAAPRLIQTGFQPHGEKLLLWKR